MIAFSLGTWKLILTQYFIAHCFSVMCVGLRISGRPLKLRAPLKAGDKRILMVNAGKFNKLPLFCGESLH